MNKIEARYLEKFNTPSDINEHLPALRTLAEECNHITEMGVRFVVSTWAFLLAKPKKLISIDIQYYSEIEEAIKLAQEEKIDFSFIVGDTTKIEIEETDLLFIDTLHTYGQLKQELNLHAQKVRKYIAFHDTVTFGSADEQGPRTFGPGLRPAIYEFLENNSQWYIFKDYTNNNGLLVLKKRE